jgi:hypothetical protein
LPTSSQTHPGAAIAGDIFRVDYTNDFPATLPSSPSPLVALETLALPPPRFVLGDYAPASAAAASLGTAPQTDDLSDQAVRGDIARGAYGVTGAGIRVGVLSDSFNLLGGMAADIAAGNLPQGVRVLEEGPAGSHDEGRAMADLIHRIAPGAQILFHTATNGEADFAAGIRALVAAGCQVIVDDVAYLDEPFFQDGSPVQAAVEQAVAAGVSYFTAAGNEGQDYIQQNFTPMHVTLPGLPPGAAAQNFGSAAAPQPWLDVTVPAGGECLLDLQWNQPYGNAANSLGMALFDANGALVATAAADQSGGNPDQVLSYVNTGQQAHFRLVLYANGGSAPPGLFKIISYGNGGIASPAAGQGSGSVIGHEMVPGANTVGAMAWSASPRFGGADAPESFSSVGMGTFLFSTDGVPLPTPQSTDKVDFLAPDGSITSTLAPFYGTSAAAANAAGVAALVLQADPALTPVQVTQVLERSALPAHGATQATGAGLIQADAAVGLALALVHGNA